MRIQIPLVMLSGHIQCGPIGYLSPTLLPTLFTLSGIEVDTRACVRALATDARHCDQICVIQFVTLRNIGFRKTKVKGEEQGKHTLRVPTHDSISSLDSDASIGIVRTEILRDFTRRRILIRNPRTTPIVHTAHSFWQYAILATAAEYPGGGLGNG